MKRSEVLRQLESRLRQRREELLRAMMGELKDLGADHGEGDVDALTDDVASLLADLSTQELRQVNEALERIDADDFGDCEECGQPIPLARLKAMPHARTCVTCQEHRDRRLTRPSSHAAWRPETWLTVESDQMPMFAVQTKF